jgi:hypothetical protein
MEIWKVKTPQANGMNSNTSTSSILNGTRDDLEMMLIELIFYDHVGAQQPVVVIFQCLAEGQSHLLQQRKCKENR